MEKIKRITLIIVVVSTTLLAVVFALTNTGSVTVDWLLFDLTAPVFLWVVGSFLVGGAAGLMACSGLYIRYKRNIYNAQRQLVKTEKELERLRTSLVKG